VLECAVVSAPDKALGEAPVAIVVIKPGESTTVKELRDHCKVHLARFKVPRDIHFRDALPKGGTGKVLKTELREPFWKGHDSRVQ
jgi:long-chain acyl-CoA synthetase